MQDSESTSDSSLDDDTFRFMPEMLDLLVDGELSDKERRQVLQYLDKTKDGWRDCALAFLESAMFKESLASDTGEEADSGVWEELLGVSASGGQQSVTDRISPGNRFVNKTNFFMVAAGFLFAFLFYGIVFFVMDRSSSTPENMPSSPILVNHEGITQDSPIQNHAVSGPMLVPLSPLSNTDLQYVTLDSCNPEWKGKQIPCYSGKTVDPKTYLADFAMMENEHVRQLLDAGHEVDVTRQNRVMPVDDGRKVVIPVDHVNVKYRPQPKYQ